MSLKDVEPVRNHLLLSPQQVRTENFIEMEKILISNNERNACLYLKKVAVSLDLGSIHMTKMKVININVILDP